MLLTMELLLQEWLFFMCLQKVQRAVMLYDGLCQGCYSSVVGNKCMLLWTFLSAFRDSKETFVQECYSSSPVVPRRCLLAVKLLQPVCSSKYLFLSFVILVMPSMTTYLSQQASSFVTVIIFTCHRMYVGGTMSPRMED